MQLKWEALGAGLQKPKPLLTPGLEQSTESRIVFFQLTNSSLYLAARLMVMGTVIKTATAILLPNSMPLRKDPLQV